MTDKVINSKNKSNKKIVIASVVLGIILICAVIVAVTIIAGNKNKQVDASASTIIETVQSCKLTPDMDNSKAFANVVELTTFREANIDENSLTYFDGSKNKYNEVYDIINGEIQEYVDYFTARNEAIFNAGNIDVNAASKDELNAALAQLTQLSADMTEELNNTCWDKNDPWSVIWGDNPETAKNNYTEYQNKVNNKINEINAKLAEIGAAEAAQAAANAQAATNNNGTRNNSGSGGNYNNGGSGGGGGNSGDWAAAQEASRLYGIYRRDAVARGLPVMSFLEWCAANGYH